MAKVSWEFDPFEETGIEIKSASKRREALQEASDFIRDAVLNHVGDGRSPVKGGQWKRSLSKEYKEFKTSQGGASFANMELEGDMLSAFDVKPKSSKKIEMGVYGSQADKADGHNNHSGLSELPPREFIPKPGQTLKREIIQGVKAILEDYADED